MDDLISRQAAIALMCRALHHNYEEGYAVTQMLELPSAQQWIPVTERLPFPTADMVEVVRCKDCKHRGYIVKDSRGYEWIEYEETSHCPFQCYDDDYYNRLSEDDFFCANGERREDG